MRILVVEDDKRIANFLKTGLREQGFAVDLAYDFQEGKYMALEESYDLIILDLMLPNGNGLDICKALRKAGSETPVLILTAKTQVDDRIVGLNAGADDYLGKPFAFSELLARVQALIRRSHQNASPTLKIGELELNPISHEVKRNGIKIDLSPKEFAVLEFLMRHKNQVVTRTMILEHVWDYNFESFSNIVDVYVTHLRKKINNGYTQNLIHSIHGVGFKIND